MIIITIGTVSIIPQDLRCHAAGSFNTIITLTKYKRSSHLGDIVGKIISCIRVGVLIWVILQ